VVAQVDIQAGPYRVVSLMSTEAVDQLGLAVGSIAVAVIKSTTVAVEQDPQISGVTTPRSST
jgi:molybdopterin-binding protein